MHYLRISLVVDSEEDIDVVREALSSDLECSLDGVCKVVNITHDRELANAFVQAQCAGMHEVLTPQVPSLSCDVATVLGHYSFTLPKQKKGEPDWRVPKKKLFGEIQGLHTLRGEIVLTNGIIAFLVREDGCWYNVHWNHFIADDLDALPDDLPRPFKESKEDKKTELLFAGF
jgi:hypothetical protein